MNDETEQLLAYLTADPTGQLHDGLGLVDRYLEAVERQHALMFDAWRQKRYKRALVELHFFLIAIDRVKDGIVLASNVLGTEMASHVGALDLSAYKRARDHFEHIEDRLYGSRKNALKKIEEAGNERTIHYGLSAEDKSFRWSDQKIDVSEEFLSSFLSWAAEAKAIANRSI
ncbi:hypothetical protein EJ069_12405 [Mesorhizobium sp. M2A.F.Ca.ET.043.05.1.1]|uniref:hypothetical protein n=1 Tax=Mesorhizobium sp. M2A.F.Ca.ET.043.05.1.1 TaxID=2493671 RepID=UPI000F75369D|nr:hypothetical protein [Mesorhizobium sp. M2A.F.Ca.ET.043.05.1.1]AZO15451.1 hypothetical protein EJ069_12405 [Mesorhizobium sp. M2A.F.Ca.ET.043.05.1.1]TIV74903.1 MAG: hypothetical protein E5V93_15100 [Mesorhizobium sp.]